MKNIFFSRAFGVSTAIALSGLTFMPANAEELSAAPSETVTADQDQLPIAEKYDYVSAGDQDVHGETMGTITPVILVRADALEIFAPAEATTFELLDVPEGIELSVNEQGVISYQVLDNEGQGTFAFKMKMTYADGSSDTDDYRIIYRPNPYTYFDAGYSGSYENLQVGQKYTATPEMWSRGMLTERVALPAGYFTINKTSDNISATINPSTGEVTFEFIEGNIGDSGTISVTMRDANGFAIDFEIERTLGFSIPMAQKIMPSYEEGSLVSIVAGRTYQLNPSYGDFTSEAYLNNRSEAPPLVAGMPEGTTVSLLESSPELTMSVDSQTGVVTYSLAEVPEGETTYTFTLLWTFADGSSTEYEGYLTVVENKLVQAITLPAPDAEADPDDASKATPVENKTDVAPSKETSEPATAPVASSAPVAKDSSQVSAPSEKATAAPTQLAHTGPSSLLLIFCTGLVMLGAGTFAALRGYKH